MRKTITLLLLINSLYTFSQKDIRTQVSHLKREILKVEGSKKLKLMDSLCKLSKGQKEFKYDSITKATIDYAIALDSTRLALIYSTKLVQYFHDNSGEIKLGIETFLDLKSRFAKNDNYSELGKFYSQGARGYLPSGRFKEALIYLDEAHGFALKAKNHKLMALTKEDIGHAYAMMGDFQRATAELQEAIEIHLKFTPDNASFVKRSLAILYSQNGLHEEAKKLRIEVIDFAKRIKNNSLIYIAFFDQAFDEELQGNQKERLRNLDSAKVYTKQLAEYYSKELAIAQLGAYSDNGLLHKAKQAKQQLEELLKGDTNPSLQDYNFAMAKYQFASGNYTQAATLGEKQNETFTNQKFYEGIYLVNDFLAKVYNRIGDQKRAYGHLKLSSKIKDSIKSVQKANGFSYYQTLYETEKRDSKIASQQGEIEVLGQKNKVKQQWIIFGLLALFTIIYLVRSRQFATSKQVLQEQFSQDLINEQEKERTRLARELHDSVGQKLMLLSKTTKNTGNIDAQNLASATLEEVREISRGLHPGNLERLGLTESINALVYSVNANTELFFTDEVDKIDNLLSKEDELHLYRIIQETLSNIVKHAEAKAVKMNINKLGNTINVVVSDNGKGFDFDTKYKTMSLGLKTLLERAKIIGANIHFDSQISNGTKITLSIPI